MKKFEITRDDLKIRGESYGKQDGKRPAIILSHGFMANYLMCKRYAEKLADAGFATFTFDFCGGGLIVKSTGKTYDMSVLTEVKDLKAVIEYVKTLDYVDSNDISLLGCSQGGLVSALVAAELKKEISSLALLYPALCIPDDARAGHMMFLKFDPQNIPERMKCGPMKLGRCYVEDVYKMGPYEEISGYEGNVLIIHGTADQVVNINYSRRAKEVYSNCEYHEIEGAPHGFMGKQDDEAVEYITTFFKKNREVRYATRSDM